MLAAIAVSLAAGSFPVSQASADGEVKVEFRGDSIPIQLEDLGPPDIPDSSYKLEGNWVTRSGYSLRAVLEAAASRAGFQLVTVVSVEIDARPGTRTIARSQIDNGPPIFFGEDGGTSWILPGSGGGDAQLFAFKGSNPVIRVNYGTELQVDLSATPAKVGVGEEVQLKASVSGQGTGEKLTYKWNFGDGKVLVGESGKVRYQFTERGSYQVNLEVTAPSGGGSAHTTIQVGKAKKPEKEKTPDGKKDGKKGEDGKKDRTAGQGTGNGSGNGTGSGNGAGTGSGETAGSDPGTGLTSPGTTDASPDDNGAEAPSRDRRQPESEQPGSGQSDQGLVSGYLIDPADLSSNQPSARDSGQPELEQAGQGGSGLKGAAMSVTGILILLALGSSVERLLFRRE